MLTFVFWKIIVHSSRFGSRMLHIQSQLQKPLTHQLGTTPLIYPLSPGHSQGSGSVVLIRHYGPVVSDQLFSSRSIHSQLDAFSGACPSLPAALFLSPALIPSLPSILHNDWAGNPLHPISTGNNHDFCTVLVVQCIWPSSVHRLPHILSPRGPSAPPSPISCHLERRPYHYHKNNI